MKRTLNKTKNELTQDFNEADNEPTAQDLAEIYAKKTCEEQYDDLSEEFPDDFIQSEQGRIDNEEILIQEGLEVLGENELRRRFAS